MIVGFASDQYGIVGKFLGGNKNLTMKEDFEEGANNFLDQFKLRMRKLECKSMLSKFKNLRITVNMML